MKKDIYITIYKRGFFPNVYETYDDATFAFDEKEKLLYKVQIEIPDIIEQTLTAEKIDIDDKNL